jgi:hypothetical protein
MPGERLVRLFTILGRESERKRKVIVCEFCTRYGSDGKCGLGLNIPKGMGCREFEPGLERFCSDPKDFVSPRQIIEMATHFGIKGAELKKIKRMTAREESARM